jgi:hypothetical protein
MIINDIKFRKMKIKDKKVENSQPSMCTRCDTTPPFAHGNIIVHGTGQLVPVVQDEAEGTDRLIIIIRL